MRTVHLCINIFRILNNTASPLPLVSSPAAASVATSRSATIHLRTLQGGPAPASGVSVPGGTSSSAGASASGAPGAAAGLAAAQRLRDAIAKITVSSALAASSGRLHESNIWSVGLATGLRLLPSVTGPATVPAASAALTPAGPEDRDIAAYLAYARSLMEGVATVPSPAASAAVGSGTGAAVQAAYRRSRLIYAAATGAYELDPVAPLSATAAASILAKAGSASSSWAPEGNESIASAADELALRFLVLHGYDIPRAKLLLAAQLGGGMEAACMDRLAELLDSRQTLPDDSQEPAAAVHAEPRDAVRPGASASATAPAAAVASLSPLLSGGRTRRSVASEIAAVSQSSGHHGAAVDLGLGTDLGLNPQWQDGHNAVGASAAAFTVPVFYDDLQAGIWALGMPEVSAFSGRPDLAPAIAPQPGMSVPSLLPAAGSAAATATAGSGAAADGSAPVSGAAANEQQKVRRWKAWLAEAQAVILANAPQGQSFSFAANSRTTPPGTSPWDALVAVRAQAKVIPRLNPYFGGGNNAQLAGEVTRTCSVIGTRLHNAVRWRARVRDALCGITSFRGPAAVQVIEGLLSELPTLQVEVPETPLLQTFLKEAKAWVRAADEGLKRCHASAGAVAAAELLHIEDAALAGPENDYISLPNRQTPSISAPELLAGEVRSGDAVEVRKQPLPSVVLPTAGLPAGAAGGSGSVVAAAAGKRASRSAWAARDGSPEREREGDAETAPRSGSKSEASRSRTSKGVTASSGGGAGAATNPLLVPHLPPLAALYSTRFAALLAASERDAAVALDYLLQLREEASRTPLCLHPHLADLERRIARTVEVARRIREHFPNIDHPFHIKGAAGTRLPQGYGLSDGLVGSTAIHTVQAAKDHPLLAGSAAGTTSAAQTPAASAGAAASSASAGGTAASSGAGAATVASAGAAAETATAGAAAALAAANVANVLAGAGHMKTEPVVVATAMTVAGTVAPSAAIASVATANAIVPSVTPASLATGLRQPRVISQIVQVTTPGAVVVKGANGEIVPVQVDPSVLQHLHAAAVASGTLLDHPTAYFSYLQAHYDDPNGTSIHGAAGPFAKRARVPWSHLDALARDVRETGVAFLEGEVLKAVHLEALNWLARSHEVVSSRRRGTVSEIRDLLTEADALPVDMSERVAVLRVELERARRWIAHVRELVPARSQRTRQTINAGPKKEASLPELVDAVAQARDGMIPIAAEETAELTVLVDTAEEWIVRVRAALDRTPLAPAETAAGAGTEAAVASVSSIESAAAAEAQADLDKEVSLQELQLLLREADDIPVSMLEYELLQAEVSARRWAVKARKALSAPTGARLETLRDLSKEIKAVRSALGAIVNQSQATGEHSQQHQAPSIAAYQLPKFEEENEIRKTIAAADEWLAKAKRLLGPIGQSSGGSSSSAAAAAAAAAASGSRRVETKKLRALLQTANVIPVNLGTTVRQLESILSKVDSWTQAAAPALERVRAAAQLERSFQQWISAKTVKGAKKLAQALAAAPSDAELLVQCRSFFSLPPVTLQELRDLITASEALGAIPDSEDEIRAALLSAEAWSHAACECMPRLPAVKTDPLPVPLETVLAKAAASSASASGSLLEGLSSAAQEKANAAAAKKAAARVKAEESFTNAFAKGEYDHLYDARGRLDLSAKTPLESVRRAIEKGLCQPIDFSSVLLPLVAEYKQARRWQASSRTVLAHIGAFASAASPGRCSSGRGGDEEDEDDEDEVMDSGASGTATSDAKDMFGSGAEACGSDQDDVIAFDRFVELLRESGHVAMKRAEGAGAEGADAASSVPADTEPAEGDQEEDRRQIQKWLSLGPQSAPGQVDACLEWLLDGASRILLATAEEKLVRILEKHSQWICKAQTVIKTIVERRAAVKLALLSGLRSATVYAPAENKDLLVSAGLLSDSATAGLATASAEAAEDVGQSLSRSGSLPLPYTVADIPVAYNPLTTSWDTFLSRRVGGSAAFVAAAYWVSRPHAGLPSVEDDLSVIIPGEDGVPTATAVADAAEAIGQPEAAMELMQGSAASSATAALVPLASGPLLDLAELQALLREGEALGFRALDCADPTVAAAIAEFDGGFAAFLQPIVTAALTTSDQATRTLVRKKRSRHKRGGVRRPAGASAAGAKDAASEGEDATESEAEAAEQSEGSEEASVAPERKPKRKASAVEPRKRAKAAAADAEDGAAEEDEEEGDAMDASGKDGDDLKRTGASSRNAGRKRARASGASDGEEASASASASEPKAKKAKTEEAVDEKDEEEEEAADDGQDGEEEELDGEEDEDEEEEEDADAARKNRNRGRAVSLASSRAMRSSHRFTERRYAAMSLAMENQGSRSKPKLARDPRSLGLPVPFALLFNGIAGSGPSFAVSAGSLVLRAVPTTALSAQSGLRMRMFTLLHSEVLSAENWTNQAANALSSNALTLPAALNLLSGALPLSVRLPAVFALRQAVTMGRRWFARAISLLPPDQQVVTLPVDVLGSLGARTAPGEANAPLRAVPALALPSSLSMLRDALEPRVLSQIQVIAPISSIGEVPGAAVVFNGIVVTPSRRLWGPQVASDTARKANDDRDGGADGVAEDSPDIIRTPVAKAAKPRKKRGGPRKKGVAVNANSGALSDASSSGDEEDGEESDEEAEGEDDVEATIGLAGGWLQRKGGVTILKRPALEAFEAVVQLSSNLRIYTPLAKRMRLEARAARRWLDDVRRSGLDSGTASIASVQSLVEASSLLWIDVSETVERMNHACALYCVCKQPFAAPMIECPGCQQLFHCDCVSFCAIGSKRALRHEAANFRCPGCLVQSAIGGAMSTTRHALQFLAQQTREQRQFPDRWTVPEEQAAELLRLTLPNWDRVLSIAGPVQMGFEKLFDLQVATKFLGPKEEHPDYSAENPPAVLDVVCVSPLQPPNTIMPSQVVAPSYSVLPWLSEPVLRWIDEACRILFPETSNLSTNIRHPSHVSKLVADGLEFLPSARHPLVRKVLAGLRAILWARVASKALTTVCKLPELVRLYTAGRAVPFAANEPVMTHISALIARSAHWKARTNQLLCGRGPASIPLCQALVKLSRRIPVDFAEEDARLDSIIQDEGRAWCICRGLTGGFMIGCDYCEEWYHGRCIGITEAEVKAVNAAAAASASSVPRGASDAGSSTAGNDAAASVEKAKEDVDAASDSESDEEAADPQSGAASAGAGGEQQVGRSNSRSGRSRGGPRASRRSGGRGGRRAAAALAAAMAGEGASGQQAQGGATVATEKNAFVFRCLNCCNRAGLTYPYASRLRYAQEVIRHELESAHANLLRMLQVHGVPVHHSCFLEASQDVATLLTPGPTPLTAGISALVDGSLGAALPPPNHCLFRGLHGQKDFLFEECFLGEAWSGKDMSLPPSEYLNATGYGQHGLGRPMPAPERERRTYKPRTKPSKAHLLALANGGLPISGHLQQVRMGSLGSGSYGSMGSHSAEGAAFGQDQQRHSPSMSDMQAAMSAEAAEESAFVQSGAMNAARAAGTMAASLAAAAATASVHGTAPVIAIPAFVGGRDGGRGGRRPRNRPSQGAGRSARGAKAGTSMGMMVAMGQPMPGFAGYMQQEPAGDPEMEAAPAVPSEEQIADTSEVPMFAPPDDTLPESLQE
jgi:hypothetical protein